MTAPNKFPLSYTKFCSPKKFVNWRHCIYTHNIRRIIYIIYTNKLYELTVGYSNVNVVGSVTDVAILGFLAHPTVHDSTAI